MRQLGNRIEFDSLTLACDVGGTNTSIAVVGRLGSRFDILQKYRYRTQKLDRLEDGIDKTLAALREATPHLMPNAISISGAGPVANNVCNLTNATWDIDGNAIGSHTGIPTVVINDFSAISYGIPLLDVEDPEQITPLPLPDGRVPPQHGPIQAVVGAGTGLGVGFLVEHRGEYRAYPSEGGHSAFSPVDEFSGELYRFVHDRVGKKPGAEMFVSGQGLANIFAFYRSSNQIPATSSLSQLERSEMTQDVPAAVSQAAHDGDETAREIMRLFVQLYAQFAGSAALHFFPTGGLFLAGGIVTKNEPWFLEDGLFIRTFVQNYRDHISDALSQFPVFIVKDYAISLYGAAHAALVLMDLPK